LDCVLITKSLLILGHALSSQAPPFFCPKACSSNTETQHQQCGIFPTGFPGCSSYVLSLRWPPCQTIESALTILRLAPGTCVRPVLRRRKADEQSPGSRPTTWCAIWQWPATWSCESRDVETSPASERGAGGIVGPETMAAADASARGQRVAILATQLHQLTGFYLRIDCRSMSCGGERGFVAKLADSTRTAPWARCCA
jgi:hypothetical protein